MKGLHLVKTKRKYFDFSKGIEGKRRPIHFNVRLDPYKLGFEIMNKRKVDPYKQAHETIIKID